MVVVLFFFSLFLLSLAVGIIRAIISRKAEAARIAAEEAAHRRKAEQMEAARRRAVEKKAAAQAEKERAAGIRKAEQERKKAEKAAARAAREAEQEEKRQKKLAAARELAELNERALKAARELKALQAGKMDAEPEARPAAAPEAAPETVAQAEPEVQEERPETISSPAPAESKKPEARAPFSNQVVSFTGRLQSMRRREAIEKVKAAGGKAFSEMPSFTTMLVVGVNPGMKKLDKYDNMIGQVRKITEAQFLEMLKGA